MAGALIQFLIWFLVVVAWFFFTSRKKKGVKGA
jgi:hypothetical protein